MTLPRLQRDRLAAPVVLVYGLMLIAGLGVYTLTAIGDATPLWIGTIVGTSAGVIAALQRLRWWVMVGVVLTLAMVAALALLPDDGDDKVLTVKAFVPAAICAYACLSDRHVIVAMWFPTVIWMLSILDHGRGHAMPEEVGVALLGALAVMFIAFLRVRESRRIALWTTVSTRPTATMARTKLLHEAPGRPLLRAGWTFAITTLAFGVTAWVAPKLWSLEVFTRSSAARQAGSGTPCCPTEKLVVERRSRIGEYFGGRTRTDKRWERDGRCVACGTGGSAFFDERGRRIWWSGSVVGGASGGGAGGAGGVGGGPSTGEVAAVPMRPDPVPRFQPRMQDLPPSLETPSVPATPPSSAPVQPAPPTATPLPTIAPPPTPSTPSPQPVASPAPTTDPDAGDPTMRPDPAPTSGDPEVGAWLRWLVFAVVAAITYQALGFLLRPLRRAITLRHLRVPFWDETVGQRISNAWQLALVGLRDAGTCTSDTEPPGELVRRANVAGLDHCATILDRARYGIALGPGDVEDMVATADAVYRTAREPLGMFARLAAAVRRPLV